MNILDTEQLPQSNVREDIHAMRQRMPFIPILPWPQKSLIVAVDNTGRIDVSIPEGAILCIAKGMSGTQVYMSVGGDSGADATLGGDLVDRGIALTLTLPEYGPFYCPHISALSFSTLSATAMLVSLSFWTKID